MSPRSSLLVLLAIAVSPVIDGFNFRWVYPGSFRSKCPEWGSDHPCTCSEEDPNGKMVECVMSWNSTGVAEALSKVDDDRLLRLKIVPPCISLNEVPTIAINMTYFLSLSECFTKGLEKPVPVEWPELKMVEIDSLKSMHSPWFLLKKAKALSDISVKGFSMTHVIGQDFRQQVVSSLSGFFLTNTATHTIEPGSMSHLLSLRNIVFDRIPIKFFPRSALPKKLFMLGVFHVTNTLLEKLEPSFFDGMPLLHNVALNGNKFTTLDSTWFTPFTNKIIRLNLNRNPLLCSCDLLWMKPNREDNIESETIFTNVSCYDSAKNLQYVRTLDEKVYCKDQRSVEIFIKQKDEEKLQESPMRLKNVYTS